MGSFSEEILGSDEALDAYYTYIDHYNRGKSHNEIMEALRHSSMPQFVGLPTDDDADAWLGLAFAQWERKKLDPDIHAGVTHIIANRLGLTNWQGSSLEHARWHHLKTFAETIKTPPNRAKPKRKPSHFKAPFQKGQLLTWQRQDGTWGGAACLGASRGWTEIAYVVLILLHVREPKCPNAETLLDAEIVTRNDGAWDGAVAIGLSMISKQNPEAGLDVHVVGHIETEKVFGDLIYNSRDWNLDVTIQKALQHPCIHPGRTLRAFLTPPSDVVVQQMMQHIGAATTDGWSGNNPVSAYEDALRAWHRCGWAIQSRSEPAVAAVVEYFGVSSERATHVLGWVLQHGTYDPEPDVRDGPVPPTSNATRESFLQRLMRWFHINA